MKKMLLIVNPNAGRGAYKFGFADCLQTLFRGGYAVEVVFTSGRGDAGRLSKELAPGCDVVCCIGGDGTLSEVVGGLMTLDAPPPIGYIPMGTANDVATTLGLPKSSTVEAAERILKGTPHPFDIGGFGADDYFAYIAAFGAFTEVSYATPQDQKKRLGHLAYVLQGAASLPKIEAVNTRVEFDDGVIEGRMVYGSMSNSTSVAGIVKLPEEMVCLGDGYSELVLVKEPERIEEYGELVADVISSRFRSDKLIILHTKKARFTFEKPVAWTRDGEAGGSYKQIELCNYRAPVNFIF